MPYFFGKFKTPTEVKLAKDLADLQTAKTTGDAEAAQKLEAASNQNTALAKELVDATEVFAGIEAETAQKLSDAQATIEAQNVTIAEGREKLEIAIGAHAESEKMRNAALEEIQEQKDLNDGLTKHAISIGDSLTAERDKALAERNALIEELNAARTENEAIAQAALQDATIAADLIAELETQVSKLSEGSIENVTNSATKLGQNVVDAVVGTGSTLATDAVEKVTEKFNEAVGGKAKTVIETAKFVTKLFKKKGNDPK